MSDARENAADQPKRDPRDNLRRGGGRTSPNKHTALLKDAILQAATLAGGGGSDGLVNYLKEQAEEEPRAFLPLLGKVLPMQVTGQDGGPIQVARIELVAKQ